MQTNYSLLVKVWKDLHFTSCHLTCSWIFPSLFSSKLDEDNQLKLYTKSIMFVQKTFNLQIVLTFKVQLAKIYPVLSSNDPHYKGEIISWLRNLRSSNCITISTTLYNPFLFLNNLFLVSKYRNLSRLTTNFPTMSWQPLTWRLKYWVVAHPSL